MRETQRKAVGLPADRRGAIRARGVEHSDMEPQTSHEIAWRANLVAVKIVSQELLGEATRRLSEEFHPEEIWLFGSHAWGTPHEDSDVDLMVIVPRSDERAIRRMQRAHHCLQGIGFPKDVLVPTRADVDRYKHLRASLYHQVLNRGRKLYG